MQAELTEIDITDVESKSDEQLKLDIKNANRISNIALIEGKIEEIKLTNCILMILLTEAIKRRDKE